MKSITEPLLKSIYTALNGNITYLGNPVPVARFFDETPGSIYVTFGDINASDYGCADNFQYEGIFYTTIHSRALDFGGSMLPNDRVSNTVKDLIKDGVFDVLAVDGFQMISLNLDNQVNDDGLFDKDRIARTQITWRFIISEEVPLLRVLQSNMIQQYTGLAIALNDFVLSSAMNQAYTGAAIGDTIQVFNLVSNMAQSYSGTSTAQITQVFNLASNNTQSYTGAAFGDITVVFELTSNNTQDYTGSAIGDIIGSGLLLDAYPMGTGGVAYSFRQLKATDPNAVRVRRSGDALELDFTGSEVQDGTLTAWVVAGGGTQDGFVVTWYDHNEGTINPTQATASGQPTIVSGGSIVTGLNNTLPALSPNNDILSSAPVPPIAANATASIFIVAGTTNDAILNNIFNTGPVGSRAFLFIRELVGDAFVNKGTQLNYTGAAANINETNLITLITGNASIDTWVNTVANVSSTATQTSDNNDFYLFGYSSANRNLAGTAQEILIYPSDESANRTAIETDINTFYSI